jgi:hypothetical protein
MHMLGESECQRRKSGQCDGGVRSPEDPALDGADLVRGLEAGAGVGDGSPDAGDLRMPDPVDLGLELHLDDLTTL